jgi:hypothetical protein
MLGRPRRLLTGSGPEELSKLASPARAPSLTGFSLVLGWMVLLFGIATALATAWIVYKTFSPILFFDQWAVVNQLMQSNGRLSLAQLWQQLNEHRIPWGKLACYLDLKLFGGRNISLLVESYMIQAMEALLFIWIFRRYRGSNLAEVMTAAGFFLFCMFYPIQIENFYWGFQVAFVTLPFAACLSIGAAIVHADLVASQERPPWCSWPLVVSLGAAMLAETSLASGILLWPLLLVLSFILGLARKTKCLIAFVGSCATAAFLWDYRSPSYHANPLESLRHPIAVGKFARADLAWSWDPASPTADLWPTLAQLCATIAVGVVVLAFLRMARPGAKPNKLQLFLLANAVFLSTTSFVIALGRINFGIEQANASRYQTVALAFWASFGALLLLWHTEKAHHAVRLVEIQVALVLLLLASVPRFASSAEVAKAHQMSLAQAYATLIQDPLNSQARANISPYPNFPEAHAYLQSHHLGLEDRDFHPPEGLLTPISSSLSALWKVNGFQVLPLDQCAGQLDWVKLVPGKPDLVVAGGWAWTSASATGPRRIILALEDGIIVGSGQVSLPRPDVQLQVARVTELNTGWTAEGSLPRGKTLRAFVASDHSATVCPLPNEFRRQ